MSKGASSTAQVFRKTRKGAPTSWAGTPHAPYLERKQALAKGEAHVFRVFFTKIAATDPFAPLLPRGTRPEATRQPFAPLQYYYMALTEQARWLDFDARPHGRRDRDPVDEMTLSAGGLGLLHGVGKGSDIFNQLLSLERGLSNPGM